MSNNLIDTSDSFQMTAKTLRQMARQGVGHSSLHDIADKMSGKRPRSEKKLTKKQIKRKKKKSTRKKPTKKRRTKKQKIADAKKGKYINPLTNRKCSYKYALKKGFITELGEKIPLKDMKFENPETGRMVSYSYAKQKGII